MTNTTVFNKFFTLVIVLSVISITMFAGCEKKQEQVINPQPAEKVVEEKTVAPEPAPTPAPVVKEEPKVEPKPEPVVKKVEPKPKPVVEPPKRQIKLGAVIARAQTWSPILINEYGKDMPDFSFVDIDGKNHKLSDFKGKDVIIVLWATWCGPCKMEIPHLKALRTVKSDDELTIIGLSDEGAELVKQFAEKEKMNYIVSSFNYRSVGWPMNQVRGIPTSFFLDKDGKIKVVTQGTAHLGDMKLILEATP